jgi:adenosylhomocysteinase
MEMVSKIAKPELEEFGEMSYNWAKANMPALVRTIEKLKNEKPLQGRKIGVCLHVTKETSVLVMGLKELGANIYLTAANPLTTQDEIAAFLVSQGINVFAWRGESRDEYFWCIRQVLQNKPEVIMDDGADCHVTYHKEFLSSFKPLGGTEETTTGIVRLKALEKEDKLAYPVIGVNNAYTKYLFDNRYGTGQSTFDGILRATSLLIAGKTVVICGYGWCGKGIAMRARGLGANVIVCEVDPLKALEAHLDGFWVMPIGEAVKYGDFFVTATGQISVIRGEHIENMKDGAVLCNAGHFNVEIDVNYLENNYKKKRRVRQYVNEYVLRSGKRVYLVGEGRIVNLVAAEGHPPEVMMMSFSNQLLSVVHIIKNYERLPKALLVVPAEIDKQVAINALEGFGIRMDKLTERQIKYAKSWEV